MPKIVNHDQRRELLAEAAWRVIRREGLEGVSVRRVAEEAGMSLGSLRHYFVTQSELLAFSMQMVSDRVNQRIMKLAFNGNPRHDIEIVIRELMPLDEERRAEAEVWLAFSVRAQVDAALKELSQEVHGSLYDGFRKMIDMLVKMKLTPEDIDAEQETKRLHALVDGLVVHCVLNPERLDSDEIWRIVMYHLDRIIVNR
ncbi:TetR family transcriptional regulator [Paenibacillus selenitireducens]|uniref:TetR family transcriptional regulator n=1 Tax=Paenibacillus selenitireducens TaxID=1324314 RepID=A0A1T2XCK7_9BACL|nr:TetR family transcriptional regulator C-terminal domain-containing protein [Paenibacillus selenitireducens]OPA77565.1 TetR family transcriptional regulator [Paenibacillus selenitireducens]